MGENFEIIEHLCVLGTSKSGWTTELNLVKWYDHELKYDIRAWAPDKLRHGKGVTLIQQEYEELIKFAKNVPVLPGIGEE